MKINTLLIANRGEIACRIARTARVQGITPVGVHSEADANALHVREIGRSILIGAGPASESYLKIGAVLDAARRVGADAIHPGYGFLAENPDFANAVEAAGMIFVGPTGETLDRFGDKASAKDAAIAAGVPVVSGATGAKSDPGEIAAAVREMGFPVLLKAVGGGGGRRAGRPRLGCRGAPGAVLGRGRQRRRPAPGRTLPPSLTTAFRFAN